jgi:hypothetical protein
MTIVAALSFIFALTSQIWLPSLDNGLPSWPFWVLLGVGLFFWGGALLLRSRFEERVSDGHPAETSSAGRRRPLLYALSPAFGVLICAAMIEQAGAVVPGAIALAVTVVTSAVTASWAWKLRNASKILYIKGTECARQLLWIWILIVLFAIAAGIWPASAAKNGTDAYAELIAPMTAFVVTGFVVLAVGRGYSAYVEALEGLKKDQEKEAARTLMKTSVSPRRARTPAGALRSVLVKRLRNVFPDSRRRATTP